LTIPNTRRFFVSPASLGADAIELADQALAHQLARVLRLAPGDQILLLDGAGLACTVELTALGRDRVAGRVVRREPAGGEPPVAVSVYLALLRPERFEWALQKCVELGARRVVPVHFARSLPGDRADSRKLERWRRIAQEAAEQSCRGVLPEVAEPLHFAAACDEAGRASLALMLWEREAPHLRSALRGNRRLDAPADQTVPTVALLSGPVGGIAAEELTAAGGHGIIPVSLGPRILRAETAPIAALAALMYELEDQG
jgi:16S rRNA (uracil1498-N3)-methyltransferase